MKKILKILIILILLFLTTGCYDYQELNNINIVTAIGFDYQDNEYITTLEITQSTNKEAKNETNTITLSGKDKSLSSSFTNALNLSNKDIYLKHIELVIISKNFAQKGISEIINYLLNNLDINNNYSLIIADNIENILYPQDKESLASIISNTLNNNTEGLKNDDITNIASSIITNAKDFALPYIETQNNQINKIAYFKGSKLNNFISNKIYRFLILDSNKTEFSKDDNVINIYQRNIKYDIKKNIITINIDCNGRIIIVNKKYNILNKQDLEEIKDLISKQIYTETDLFIKETLNNNSDLLGLKDLYYKKYKKYNNKLNYEIKINLNINRNNNLYEAIYD